MQPHKEPCIFFLRSIELYLDTHHLCLLSGNKGPLTGINRVDVHDVSILLADGEGLQAHAGAR